MYSYNSGQAAINIMDFNSLQVQIRKQTLKLHIVYTEPLSFCTVDDGLSVKNQTYLCLNVSYFSLIIFSFMYNDITG